MKQQIMKEIEQLEKELYESEDKTLDEKNLIFEKIIKLENDLFFIDGPKFTDGEIDLYREYEGKYCIFLHNTKIRIGNIEYRGKSDYKSIMGDIGYVIDEQYRGNNYALKALNLMKDIILEDGNDKVILTTYKENIASIKTIEKFGGKIIDKIDDRILMFECNILKKNKNI